MKKGFIKVGDIYVQDLIPRMRFACDYSDCKSICCWEETDVPIDGGLLTKSETLEIRKNKLKLLPYVDSDCQESLLKRPAYRNDGEYYTGLKTPNGKCIFSNTEKKSCSFKLAHADGISSFSIPVYCELCPMGVTSDEEGNQYLMYLPYGDCCKSATIRGVDENIFLVDFCSAPLQKIFGEDFFKELCKLKV